MTEAIRRRYEPRLDNTMWGRRVVIWDNDLNGKTEQSRTGLHIWPKTTKGWAEAALVAAEMSLAERQAP